MRSMSAACGVCTSGTLGHGTQAAVQWLGGLYIASSSAALGIKTSGKYMKSALGQMTFDYIFSETFRTLCGSPWVQWDKVKILTHACVVAFSFQFFPPVQFVSAGSIAKARYVDNFGRIGDLDVNLNSSSGLLYRAHAQCTKSFAHVFLWFAWILRTDAHSVMMFQV